MRKYSVTPKRIKIKIGLSGDGIADDDKQRLRNALLAMSMLDRGWMHWVECNVYPNQALKWMRRMVERRARCLIARNHRYMGWQINLAVIYSDYYFTDDGDLKTYL